MKVKPRKPWLALLLSIILPGLGQVYSGKAKRGIILYLILNLAFLISCIVVILPFIYLNIVLSLTILLGTYLFIIIDSFLIARKGKETFQLRTYNKWYLYLVAIIIASFVIEPAFTYVIKKFLVQAYKLPSTAMQPTLLKGDYIIANKFIYNFTEPDHGDIIIFVYPKDPSKDFLKRVVGIGGDVVEIRDKQVYINQKMRRENFIVNTDPNILSREKYPRDNFGPVSVPRDSLFVLGDNRDNSYDSRFWGFANKKTVKGKVSTIYWSWDSDTNSVRWGRIGMIVHK